jgi:hypothetical protein
VKSEDPSEDYFLWEYHTIDQGHQERAGEKDINITKTFTDAFPLPPELMVEKVSITQNH